MIKLSVRDVRLIAPYINTDPKQAKIGAEFTDHTGEFNVLWHDVLRCLNLHNFFTEPDPQNAPLSPRDSFEEP
jgi:hypothetical protein